VVGQIKQENVGICLFRVKSMLFSYTMLISILAMRCNNMETIIIVQCTPFASHRYRHLDPGLL
jgi:hypothetical protein